MAIGFDKNERPDLFFECGMHEYKKALKELMEKGSVCEDTIKKINDRIVTLMSLYDLSEREERNRKYFINKFQIFVEICYDIESINLLKEIELSGVK